MDPSRCRCASSSIEPPATDDPPIQPPPPGRKVKERLSVFGGVDEPPPPPPAATPPARPTASPSTKAGVKKRLSVFVEAGARTAPGDGGDHDDTDVEIAARESIADARVASSVAVDEGYRVVS